MIGALQREKIYEALAYFSGNVRHAGKIKLFKLLYYLDLMHFRRTGRTVTGLVYKAWHMGPVPAVLDDEFQDSKSELFSRFTVQNSHRVEKYDTPTIDFSEEDVELGAANVAFIPSAIKPKTPYKHQFLTGREMEIAELLAEVFYDAPAKLMTDVSHNKFGPWKKALFKAKKTGIKRPPIDLMEGVVAVGQPKEELPMNELKEIVEERALIDQALM